MFEIINEYSIKVNNSLLLTIVFLGSYLLCKFFLTRNIKSRKARNQYITRFKYLFFIVFMIFFIKIWVEGFSQIFTYIGFLSAALTLTQRENLMNMVGWLIINWRGLFSEGDFIRISNVSGCVKSIGLLYFTLAEGNPDFPEDKTGRIVKIPNGMVSRNPIANFSQEKYVECTMNLIFKPKGTVDSLEVLFLVLKQEMHHYMQLQSCPQDKFQPEAQEPKYLVKIRHEKPAGYEMVFLFYCKYIDKAEVLYKLNKLVIDFTSQNPDLTLAFD